MHRRESLELGRLDGAARGKDIAGRLFAYLSAFLVVGVCLFIIGYLVRHGWHAVTWKFLSTDPNPSLIENQGGGIRVPLAGTAILILLSMVVAFPLGVASAVFLSEYLDERGIVAQAVRLGLEVLAGVPSIVFGMFALAVFTMPVFTFMSSAGATDASAAFGRSFLVASFVMGVHVLPFVIKVAEEAIRNVPRRYRDASAALGVTKWRATWRVVLPAARKGIVTSLLLGIGLVAGDTAITWLTLGGTMTMAVDKWWQPSNLMPVLRGPGSTLTTFTYYNSAAGDGNSPGLAFGAALVLLVLVLGLNLAAAVLSRVLIDTRED